MKKHPRGYRAPVIYSYVDVSLCCWSATIGVVVSMIINHGLPSVETVSGC